MSNITGALLRDLKSIPNPDGRIINIIQSIERINRITTRIVFVFCVVLMCLCFISCTKRASDDTILTDVYELTVTQVKGRVSISYHTEPKPYIRIMDVVVQFGAQEVGTVMYVAANQTEGSTSYNVNATMTGYYVSTWGRYWE